MKLKQLFLLTVALVMLTVALSSCELPFDLPFDIPFLGGDQTTATEATTTTATHATLPPITAAPNPITEVKSVNTKTVTGLRLTFKDKKTILFEPELGVGDGYNSVTYTHSFDKESGILTLTLCDNATNNIANQHLKVAPDTVTVCIRENNKNLEWAYEGTEEWKVLCKTSETTKKPLALLREATGIGKVEAPSEKGVYLAINDGALRFRAREWKDGIDLCMDTTLTGSSNKVFNISYMMEVKATASLSDTSNSSSVVVSAWKSSGDDITPININGTYIGANHGYNLITAMINPGTSPKTEKDIGSIWEVDGKQYVLVCAGVAPKEDKTKTATLWFCPINDAAMESGIFPASTSALIENGVTLKHVSGATNTDDLVVDRPVQSDGKPLGICQFFNAINHNKMAAFLNGNVEVDIYKNAVYNAEFIDFYEEYDIIYLPTVLQYLIENVGKNTNESHYDESLNESYVTFRNTYRYHKNGACVIYSSYVFHKDVSVGYIGGVQSIPFYGDVCSDDCPKKPDGSPKYDTAAKCKASGEGHVPRSHYVYIPGAKDYTTPTVQEGVNENHKVNIKINKEDLVNPDYLTTTYFQLTTPDGEKVMNLGFNPEFGMGVSDLRKNYVDPKNKQEEDLAFYYFNSYKMYPKLISHTTLKAGEVIDCIAYRLPSEKTDDDFFAINWYWVGENIYLSLHTSKAVAEKTVALPEYMNGMTITPVEITDSFKIVSETINNGITVSTSGDGYTIVKLSPAK